MGNNLKFTPEARNLLLECIRRTGVIGPACDEIGISRRTLANHRAVDETLEDDIKAAKQDFVDRAEAELARRAVEGLIKPVFYRGERVDNGEIREYSDQLLIALLKRHVPEYRDGPLVQFGDNHITLVAFPDRVQSLQDERRKALREVGVMEDAEEGSREATQGRGNGNGNGAGGNGHG